MFNKLHIEIFILVFMFTVMSLCVSFSIYYISPNNYKLYDIESNDKITDTKEYTIDVNKQKKFKYKKYLNKKIKISSNDKDFIPIIFENKFKSDNIYLGKNKLVSLINSDLIIKNTLDTPINIKIEIYN